MEIKKILYKTIHRGKDSVEEIADRIGCSASLLYRCANPNDSGARFPLEKVLPLMRAVNDFSILKHLASRSGFVFYKVPSRVKYNKVCDLCRYQALMTDTFRAILDFKEGAISRDQCLSRIDELLSGTVELRGGIESHEQMEFHDGEE